MALYFFFKELSQYKSKYQQRFKEAYDTQRQSKFKLTQKRFSLYF